MTQPVTSKEELALTIDVAEWQWIRPHLERDALVVVAPGLELAEAGWRIATDDTAAVSAWIREGELGKPDAGRIERWNATPARLFSVLIVSPYILIQERPDIL